MAKNKENTEVMETVENPVIVPENANPIVEAPETTMDVVDLEDYAVVKHSKNSVAKNILTGVGISVVGVIALYGLYELGKKGFKMLQEKIEQNKEKKVIGNGLDHPEYEYKKVDVEESEAIATATMKGEKAPMGFRYEK